MMKDSKKEVGLGALLLGAVSYVCLRGMKAIDKKMKDRAAKKKP